MTDDVVIAGLGAVTGYGIGMGPLWDGLVEGRSAGRTVDIDGEPCLAATTPDRALGDAATLMEATTFAALDEAVGDAKERGWERSERVGLIHCTGIGDIALARDGYFRDRRPRPSMFPHVLHTSIPSLVAMRLDADGPSFVLNAACASANIAVLTAADWLRRSLCDDVVVTSSEFCVIREVVVGFRQLKVLVDRGEPFEACSPFSDASKGFFLGEAAVAVVLSRSDTGYARIVGGCFNHDAFHIAAINPNGERLRTCFQRGLIDAGLTADDVAYFNAHGSGTKLNDTVEAAAAGAVFPAAAIYATKPMTGHCMGASAAVELAIAAKTYQAGFVPGTPSLGTTHPMLVTRGEPLRSGATACSAIGIGGFNSVVLLEATGDAPVAQA